VNGGLGRRYARALLELAQEAGTAAPVGDDLARLAAAFEDPSLQAVVSSPAIAGAARRKVVADVVAAVGVSKLVANLVGLLADRGRLLVLPDVARSYERLLDQRLGRARVRIASAVALTPAQKAELTDLAKRLTGRQDVIVTTAVDADLLGGVVLDAGGTVYDGTIRTQLVRLSKEMAGA
jgi:F-type H+-transporting ATPase subunit delta